MNPESQNSSLKLSDCDLCGAKEANFILKTQRLDGPLVRCRNCELYYVVLPDNKHSEIKSRTSSEQVTTDMARLAERARELALVEPEVEQSEQPWRELMARERLDDLKRFVTGGRLLEIGCSTGEMLLSASDSFEVFGVEADAISSRTAASRGLECFNGALTDAQFPGEHFSAAALYHVIEHFHSPRTELRELHRVIKPGGWLAIETPNIANIWFRLLGARWRQIIPDHLYFFTPQTMTRLCASAGFEVRELRNVGKAMSARLLISRIGRYNQPLARTLSYISRALGFDDRTLRLNFGDVMRLYAQRK